MSKNLVHYFSGDQDAKIPLTQTRIIANALAKDAKLLATSKYAPWYDNLQVGGWSQSFGQLMKGNITYLTFATVQPMKYHLLPLHKLSHHFLGDPRCHELAWLKF